jgi:hypothetical protein
VHSADYVDLLAKISIALLPFVMSLKLDLPLISKMDRKEISL